MTTQIVDNLESINYHLQNIFGSAPKKQIVESKYIRWGNNCRFWARRKDNCIFFGDFVSNEKWVLKHDDFIQPKRNFLVERKQNNLELLNKIKYIQFFWNSEFWDWEYGDNGYFNCRYCWEYAKKVRKFNNLLHIPYEKIGIGITGIQTIASDGAKKFIHNSVIKGAFHQIRSSDNPRYIILCEGVATGASIDMALTIMTDKMPDAFRVLAVGSYSNFVNVYTEIAPRNNAEIIIFGDHGTENPLKDYGVKFIIFDPAEYNSTKKGFDANDAYCLDAPKTIKKFKNIFFGCIKND